MSTLQSQKQLGRLNTPVIFTLDEGPDPGPAAKVANADSPAVVEKGIKPLTAILASGAMIMGGYLVLRKLLE